MILKAKICCEAPVMCRCPLDGSITMDYPKVITKETTMVLHWECKTCGNTLETPTLLGSTMEEIAKGLA